MRKLSQKIYLVWGGLMFTVSLLAAMPFFLFIIFFTDKKRQSLTQSANMFVSRSFFLLSGLPVSIQRHSRLDPRIPYVFCANHTSFLDIPVLALMANRNIVFLGKDTLANAPLIGIIFRKLHIPVYRGKPSSLRHTMKASRASLQEGNSLGIFPEGTINRQPPVLKNFKEGAFRVAIQEQVPVVPVTLLNNWKIWPTPQLSLSWYPVKAIQHPPIDTAGMSMDDLPALKERVRRIIAEDLKKHHPEHTKTSKDRTL